MTSESVIFWFQVFLWTFFTVWFVGGLAFFWSIRKYKIKEYWARTKEASKELSLLGIYLIPLVIVLICGTLGG